MGSAVLHFLADSVPLHNYIYVMCVYSGAKVWCWCGASSSSTRGSG